MTNFHNGPTTGHTSTDHNGPKKGEDDGEVERTVKTNEEDDGEEKDSLFTITTNT